MGRRVLRVVYGPMQRSPSTSSCCASSPADPHTFAQPTAKRTYRMAEESRPRVPSKTGFFTIPADPNQPPTLLATVCETCGEYFYPRRAICAKCLSDRTRDVELAARRTLYNYTFVHMQLFGS